MADSDEDKFIKVTEKYGGFSYLASQDTEPSKEAIDALNEIGFDLLGFRKHVREIREEIEESILKENSDSENK